MTREEAKKFAPILQAYAEGKVIECRTDPSVLKSKDTPNKWTEIKNIEYWNNVEYRIKSESTYRPFKDIEECWNEMLRHKPFRWVKGKECNKTEHISHLLNLDSGFVYFTKYGSEEDMGIVTCPCCCFSRMFDKYTFADGTPFGIKVEE